MDLLEAGLSPEARENLFGDAAGNMLWSCRADPRFCYYAYLPQREGPLPVIVYLHGTGREYPSQVREELEAFGRRHGCCVLAPLFPGGITQPDGFNGYKLLREGGVCYDLALLELLRELGERCPAAQTQQVFLYGHSGGGQFVNRFFFLHPHRLRGVCISAPGRPTFLDRTRPFYWGTQDWEAVFGGPIRMDLLRRVPVLLVVGSRDRAFIGEAFCGQNRVERVQALHKNFLENGVPATLAILEGADHDSASQERTRRFCQWLEGTFGEELLA